MPIPPIRPACRWLRLAAAAFLGCAGGLLGAANVPPMYTLADCLDLAVKHNPDILIAAKRVEAARAGVLAAKGQLYPSVSSNGIYQHLEQEYATSGGADLTRRPEDYAITNRITQNVYSAGAVRNRIAAAKLALEAESLNYLTAVDTAALAVRLAFDQVVFAESNIGVRQQAVDILAAQLTDQRDRLKAGSVSQLNVNRAQVSLANEQPALDQARYDVRAAYVALAELLAVSYPANAGAAPFRVQGALGLRPLPATLTECLIRARQMRPEIRARKLDLESLNRQVAIEKSATRPQLSAFAGYDLFSETSQLADRDYFSGYTIGVTGSWQIFDGFATLGRVRAARARVGGGAATLAATEQQVEAEVRTAYYQWQQAEDTLRPQAGNIHMANETLDLTQSNFNASLTTQLDILQARVDLTRARTNELSARLACNQALARLDRAMGVGRPAVGADREVAAPLPK